MMRKSICCCLLAMLIGLIYAASFLPVQAFQFSISPARIDLLVEPGQTAEGAIQIGGSFQEPVRIRAFVGDWSLRPNGDIIYQNPLRDRSLAGWISLYPVEFLLADGKPQTVRYRLKVPQDITGGYWGVIFFQTVLPETGQVKGTVGLRTVGRLATAIYAATSRGAVCDGRIKSVTASWADKSLDMGLTFENRGNIRIALKGRFEVRSSDGKVVLTESFEDQIVLPQSVREIRAERPGDLAPGNYLLVALVDYGGRNAIAGQKVFKAGR